MHGERLNLETAVGRKKAVQDIGVHGEIKKVVFTLGFAQAYLPRLGRRSIPSGGVARPFHTRSMRSPRALPDRRLSTQAWEIILARTLGYFLPPCFTHHWEVESRITRICSMNTKGPSRNNRYNWPRRFWSEPRSEECPYREYGSDERRRRNPKAAGPPNCTGYFVTDPWM
jgi:hypothetical protein